VGVVPSRNKPTSVHPPTLFRQKKKTLVRSHDFALALYKKECHCSSAWKWILKSVSYFSYDMVKKSASLPKVLLSVVLLYPIYESQHAAVYLNQNAYRHKLLVYQLPLGSYPIPRLFTVSGNWELQLQVVHLPHINLEFVYTCLLVAYIEIHLKRLE
jgi:hypothetical protein